METGLPITSGYSGVICDTASKIHGAMDLWDATPLRGCARGGRTIVLISEFELAKDVEPYFQLYSASGERIEIEEKIYLTQPSDQPGNTVSILKETIVFITLAQDHAKKVLGAGWEVRLLARRKSDGLFSKTMFPFKILPHDYYSVCVFCYMNPDREPDGHTSIAPKREHARQGLRKREMPDSRGHEAI